MGGDEPPIYRKSSCEKLSAVLEKVLHQQPAFFFENTCRDAAFGMQGAGSELMIAAFGVGSAVDDARYLRPSQCPCTHGAGLNGDVECAVGQVLAAQLVAGRRDGLHLGVGRRVGQRLCQVVGAGHDALFADDNCPDGYFSLCHSLLGFVQGHAHVALVFLLLCHTARLLMLVAYCLTICFTGKVK